MNFFTPYWKKEGADAAAVIARLKNERAGRLMEIALEASSEDVAVAAVMCLGKAHREKQLRKIAGSSVSARVKAVAELQIFSQEKMDPYYRRKSDYDHDQREQAEQKIVYALSDKRILPDDVIDTIPHSVSWIHKAVMVAALLHSHGNEDQKTKDCMHRVLTGMLSAGSARVELSYLISSLPKAMEKEITEEESRKLKELYDYDVTGGKDLSLFFDPGSCSYKQYSPSAFCKLARIWARYENEPFLLWLANLSSIRFMSRYFVDVRSKEAADIDGVGVGGLAALGLQASDIPDGILQKALHFHMILPLKFLYENGKKDFVEEHFPRRIEETEKYYDPEDDRYHEENVITVLYGDPDD